MNNNKSNAIIIHGGGLVEPSKHVLMRIAEELRNNDTYHTVFIGRYSFEALFTPEFWLEYNKTLIQDVKDKRGSYFGTSRGFFLTDKELSEKAITCLKAENVKTVIVAGGDGSSRQVAEISDIFKENGINIIFAIPLTIDGINGGLSIGIEEAVRESVRQTENIVSTAFETRDCGKYGVVMVELQGRNRDDIMANVLRCFASNKAIADYNFNEILLKVIPANHTTNEKKLIDEINSSDKRTLLLVSEGAEIKIPEFTKKIKRKVRSLVVGYPSQSNNMMRSNDKAVYNLWIKCVCNMIHLDAYSSYCIVNSAKDLNEFYVEILCSKKRDKVLLKKPIDYYAKLNPRDGQKAELSDELKNLIFNYMSETE